MCYYLAPNSHISHKIKVVLDLSNYGTKKEFNYARGIDTCNLAAKSDFVALKVEVNKLGNNKLV